ncbi:MAG: hypothetical protein IPP83_12875 [Flavobacteriales bacterium]|nr:hypothetical protein [Flavobacteriales bacterium]
MAKKKKDSAEEHFEIQLWRAARKLQKNNDDPVHDDLLPPSQNERDAQVQAIPYDRHMYTRRGHA